MPVRIRPSAVKLRLLAAAAAVFGLAAALVFSRTPVPRWLPAAIAPPVVSAAVKPNIIVVMTDDLEMGTFNTMLAAGLLPNIKSRLVDKGYSFDNSFVTDSLCCPSRATFLTGQYAHNTGVKSNYGEHGGVHAFHDDSTIATWLKDAGYRTGIVGKYLNGYGTDPLAPVTDPANPAYVPPGWDSTQIFVEPSAYTAYDYKVSMNGVITDHRPFGEQGWNYHTDMMTLRGLYFIYDSLRTHPSQPFFLAAAPMIPHFHLVNRDQQTLNNECAGLGGSQAPFQSGNLYGSAPRPAPNYVDTIFGDTAHFPLPQPPSFNDANAGKPNWLQQRKAMTATDIDCLRKQYWRRMEAMRSVDDMVGAFASIADTYGILSNTVFVFTSDNGYMKGEHRLTEKQVPYEESIRVPLVIRIPGSTTPRRPQQFVLNNDLAATIADLAGATPTLTMDGRSLVPIMQGQNPAFRNAFLVEQFDGSLDTAPGGPELADFPVPESPSMSIRMLNPARLYTIYDTYYTTDPVNGQELYDLLADPHQLTNLAQDPARASEIQQFQNALSGFTSCSGAACATIEQTFSVQPAQPFPRRKVAPHAP